MLKRALDSSSDAIRRSETPASHLRCRLKVGLAVFKNLQYLDFIRLPSRAIVALKFDFGPSVKFSKNLPEHLDSNPNLLSPVRAKEFGL